MDKHQDPGEVPESAPVILTERYIAEDRSIVTIGLDSANPTDESAFLFVETVGTDNETTTYTREIPGIVAASARAIKADAESDPEGSHTRFMELLKPYLI